MISNELRLLILQSACSTRPIIGEWIMVGICYILGHSVSQPKIHGTMYIYYFLEASPRARPTWAETIMLVYDPCV
jgi:hypothetical protein